MDNAGLYLKKRQRLQAYRNDWCLFVREVFRVRLDSEQEAILKSVQNNKLTAVASGTARGKDFVAACAAMCFMYLTPRWKDGKMVANTKVALTAPTGRQVMNIMMPEVSRLFRNAGFLPGTLLSTGIRTANTEWFLTGFKAGDDNVEAWSGFHAVNTMFVVTEASGLSDRVFSAIEGNLQGNSRLLLVFNPNSITGYAAMSMTSERFSKFRLNSLNAENVVSKKNVIPGQVDYEWVKDKVENWCSPISADDFIQDEGDFMFEGSLYRPNDLFRVKVLGLFPRVDRDVLVPLDWINAAIERWKSMTSESVEKIKRNNALRLGVDVAGMGRDSSVLVSRYGPYVEKFDAHQSAGKADHMHVAGMIVSRLHEKNAKAFIDTIGEGAGVYSRLEELGYANSYSCKFSEGTRGYNDVTGQYQFANMRAYCYWAVRDWLDPKNKTGAAIPPCENFIEEITNTKWQFTSGGSIIIEPKEKIKEKIGRSPDWADALANTFYPKDYGFVSDEELLADFL